MNRFRVILAGFVLVAAGSPMTLQAKADTGARRAQAEARAHELKAKTTKTKEAREARVLARKEKTAEAKAALEDKKDASQAKKGEVVDKRQSHQSKRIENGISKGYLTTEEIAKLKAQQDSIAKLEASYRADGKLTRQESASLRAELNTASRCIWAEKHDTEGNQMATYRLGKNVYAKDDFTAKMSDPNLTATEAKSICKDFHSLITLKQTLSGSLSQSERTRLQAEYDQLLNQYFEVR